jgi:MFS family permease
MFSAAATGAVRPMLSYRAIEAGGGAVEIGVIATSYALLPVALAFAFGRRIDRHGPYGYVIGGNALFLAGIAVALVATSLPVLYLSSAMLGLGQMVAVLAQQAAAARTGPGERDRSFGRLTSAAALGQSVGPAAAALAIAHGGGVLRLSDTTIALAAGLALCLLGLPAALAMRTSVAPVDSQPAATGSSRSIAW